MIKGIFWNVSEDEIATFIKEIDVQLHGVITNYKGEKEVNILGLFLLNNN